MPLTTIADCNAMDGQSIVRVASYGAICVEAVTQQNEFIFHLPTVGTWFKNNWYVIFIIVFLVVLCIVAIALQCVRWLRRIQHRHLREERDKRVTGMVHLVSSFRVVFTPSTTRTSQWNSRQEDPSVTTTNTSSSSTSSSSDDDTLSMNVENSEADETSAMVQRPRRHHHHHRYRD